MTEKIEEPDCLGWIRRPCDICDDGEEKQVFQYIENREIIMVCKECKSKRYI